MSRIRNRGLSLLLLLSLTLIACDSRKAEGPPNHSATSAPTSRATHTFFKGVELYSWRDRGTGSWHFALVPGVNSVHSVQFILEPARRIDALDALKERLARYAPGEHMFWYSGVADANGVPTGTEFGYPAAAVVREVQEHCRSLTIDLHVVQ